MYKQGNKIIYKKGDKIGPYNIEFIEEIEPHISPSGRVRRKANFICPYDNKIFVAQIEHVNSGHTRSCGCFKKKLDVERGKKIGKKYGGISKINLTDKKFGHWTVIKDSGKRNNRKILWECFCDCGNEEIFLIRSDSLISGNSQSCGCTLESKGEEKIKLFLQKNNISFNFQYSFENCKYKKELPFDFYISNYNCCIEYDGEQHFKSIDYFGGEEHLKIQQQRDNIKTRYCEDNNIKLIRIPYWDFNNIEEILTKELNL